VLETAESFWKLVSKERFSLKYSRFGNMC